jgi:hypothetical protein
VSVREFGPELLDRLIYVLLDQESWQRAILRSLAPEPNVEENVAGKVQERMQRKILEIRERLHEGVETFRQNVAEGVQSAVGQGSQEKRRFRRPPFGRPPTGHPPSARRRMD